MKKSYITNVMGLVLVALSGHAMAASVGTSTPATANVEFSAENITSHKLTAVPHLAGTITDKPVIANGAVTVSAPATVVVQPDASLVDATDGFKMHLAGQTDPNNNKFVAYLSDSAGGAPLTESGVPGWYTAGTSVATANYTVNVDANQTVASDKYDIIIQAALYTQ